MAPSPAIDPETGLPIDPATGQPISLAMQSPAQGQPQASAPGSIYGSPQNAQIPSTLGDPNLPMQNRYTQNANIAQAGGTQINNEAQYALGYYGGLTPQYQSEMDQSLAQLQGTPGYTPGQAAQINANYSQFNSTPAQLAAIQGNPQAALQTAYQGASDQGAQLNAYGQNLSGEVGNYATGVEGAAGQYGTGVTGAVSGLQSGLSGAQNFDKLNTAVDNPALGFDPNSTEKQLTDQDVQNMKTAAGTRIGNQYQSAEDTLNRNAAAAGNTSPLALAAANARLQTQEASDQGDAEVNADIAAKQAQFGRAQGIEQQREGATQTQAGMQATAGTTEEAAAQSAAGLAGTAGIGAAENVGQAGLTAAENVGQQDINAANQYGQTAIATQGNIAQQETAAQQAADAAASARATTTANMGYQQGVGSQQLTGQGAQTVGNAQIAGQNAYRSGLQGQEQFTQTGAQGALGAQNTAYGTSTSGINNAAAAQGNFINGKPSFGDTLASGFAKSVTGLLGAEKGDIITEPQTRIVAEKEPEMIVPLGGRYRRKAA